MAMTVATTASTNATATSIAATAPASIASGDILIAALAKTVNAAPNSVPAGWTQLSTSNFRAGNPTGQNTGGTLGAVGYSSMYWKVAGGSEPATYTWGAASSATWNVQIARCPGFRGVKPGGVVTKDYTFATAKQCTRATNTISPGIIPNSQLPADGYLMFVQFVQSVSAVTATFSALSGSMNLIANVAQTQITQLVAWEYIDLTSNPVFGTRQVTTDQAAGSTSGYAVMINDPSSITAGLKAQRRNELPAGYPRGKLVN